MNIARILYPVEVLGPGKRVGIWMCGCPHHCPGCSNPELWDIQPKYEVSSELIKKIITGINVQHDVDGFIVTGGDPFYQPSSLCSLLDILHEFSGDILVYTGFTFEELKAMGSSPINYCLSKIDVLIDGRYEEIKNTGVPLRGSENQKILFLNSNVKAKYDEYLKRYSNQIQNFVVSDGVISVGIHSPNFQSDLKSRVAQKGVLIDDG